MDTFDTVDWVRALGIVAGGAVAWLAAQWFTNVVRRFLVHGEVDLESEKRVVTLVRAVRYALGTVIILVVLMMLLSALGISVTPLLGAASVAGVAIGLAAQGIARDFLRGFSMLLDDEIRVGDVVEIAGKSGIVEEVTLRRVRLREYDGTVHFVPTGQVDIVTNRSYGMAFAVLDVAVDTTADTGKAMEIIRQCGEGLRNDAQFAARITGPIDVAGIERWDDDTVVIRSRLPVAPNAQVPVRRELLARVKAAFERESIPNPTQRLLVSRKAD
jgi:small conductance mechanosensitive channel